MKKTQKWIAIIAFLFLLIISWVVAIYGISRQVTFEAGNCSSTYTHYYIRPLGIHSLICETLPCGAPQSVIIHNAKVDIIECLCKDINTNEYLIKNFYANELCMEPEDFSGACEEVTAEYICNFTKKIYLE